MLKRGRKWPITLEYDSANGASKSSAEIRDRVFTNHLVVIKGMGGMAVQEFANFAMLFGKPEEPLDNTTLHPLDDRVEVLERTSHDVLYQRVITDMAESAATRNPSSFYWHADRSFLSEPSSLTITRIVRSPQEGGNTEFINTEIAYAALSDEQKDRLMGLVGVHSYAFYHAHLAGADKYTPEEILQKEAQYPPVTHPVVQQHPVSGSAVPYTSPLTLAGFTDPEKGVEAQDALKAVLAEDQPAFYSHAWQTGDVVIWDNNGILHRGSPSTGERELHRMTLSLSKENNQ
jgi:alpha-ketoglutarate-dependent taurine dioxygenase